MSITVEDYSKNTSLKIEIERSELPLCKVEIFELYVYDLNNKGKQIDHLQGSDKNTLLDLTFDKYLKDAHGNKTKNKIHNT